jgi:hypothetical protein
MWRVFLFSMLMLFGQQVSAAEWKAVNPATLADDDIQRNSGDQTFLKGLSVSEMRFSESGFDWHLLRFTNIAKPIGPLWAVPHDDENAAFDSAIAAVKDYGGVVVAVNSGPGSARMQMGQGTCGGRPSILPKCDPNRNFSDTNPLFTRAFIDQLASGQPIIALHTNSPGHDRGRGDITILDAKAANRGETKPRKDGHFGRNLLASLADPDSYAIIPYLPPKLSETDVQCRNGLIEEGVHVWHERVKKSDGSLSNYVALNMPMTRYVNMESRREMDLTIASERHRLMIAAYLKRCGISGNQPVPRP